MPIKRRSKKASRCRSFDSQNRRVSCQWISASEKNIYNTAWYSKKLCPYENKQIKSGEIIVIQEFDKNLPEIISENKIVLVDFYADWCQPCKVMMPVIENISSKYEGKIIVGKINSDQEPSMTTSYDISALPTLILFKDGKEINRFIGLTGADKISEAIDNAF